MLEYIQTCLRKAVAGKCPHLFITAGKAVSGQKDGEIVPLAPQELTPEDSELQIRELYHLANRRMEFFQTEKTMISLWPLPGLPASGSAPTGRQVPAFEIMRMNQAVRGMIREGRTAQIDTVLQALTTDGMSGMDESILYLYKTGQVSREAALYAAMNADQLQKKIRLHMT